MRADIELNRRRSIRKVSVVQPESLGPQELALWRRMQESNPALANPFLSPGFALATGRVRPTTRVAVLEEGSTVVGFFAFDQSRFRVGKPVAAGVSDCQAVIHASGWEWDARGLLDGCGLDVLEFDHLIAQQMPSAGRYVPTQLADHRTASKGEVYSP
jgi:CelD/BcsL family acetyltransferase involved in cellulose biosynthesis